MNTGMQDLARALDEEAELVGEEDSMSNEKERLLVQQLIALEGEDEEEIARLGEQIDELERRGVA